MHHIGKLAGLLLITVPLLLTCVIFPSHPILTTIEAESPLLIGESREFGIPAKARGLFRSLSVSKVLASCGCTRITASPETVTPLSTRWIRIEARPGARDPVIQTSVDLITTNNHRASGRLHARVSPPFRGWPSAAEAMPVGPGIYSIEVDPKYSERISHVALRGDVSPDDSVIFDKNAGQVFITTGETGLAKPGAFQRALVVHFVADWDDLLTWAGPLTSVPNH